jgi:hypothetical protein
MTTVRAAGPPTTMSRPRWDLRFVALVTTIGAFTVSVWQLSGTAQLAITRIIFATVVATFLVVGILIAERRPGNRVGSIVFVMAPLFGLYLVLDAFIAGTGDVEAARTVAWITGLMDAPLFILISLLFLLFPDGRLPSPRWRRLLIADLALGAVMIAWAAFAPGRLTYYPQFQNPFGQPGTPLVLIGPVAYLLVVGGVALSAMSLVGRWRRGSLIEQAQLKWVASAAAILAIVMGSYAIVIGPGTFNQVFDLLVGIALGFFPIAIGVAILRYRLFEIDRLVSRTIAYLVVTAVLVAGYASVILVLQGPLGAVTGGDTLSVALSTLAAAALFQPLRRRVQSVVDRRFDRARFDAERTTAAFSERLRGEVDIATVTADLDGTIRTALKPAVLGLWLRGTAE